MIKLLLFTPILCASLIGCVSNGPHDIAGTTDQKSKNTSQFETYTAEQFFVTTSLSGSSINHTSDAALVSSDESGIYNAYRVPLDGSTPTQLTFSSKDSIYVQSWFPQDDRFLFKSDQGGNELHHLYVGEIDGTQVDLTPGERLQATFAGWHQNKKEFFIYTNERDPRFFDLYRYSTKDYSRTKVFTNNFGFNIESVSPDGHFIALSKSNSNSDSDIYIVDLRLNGADPKLITEHSGNIKYASYGFTKDSSQLLYSTDEHGEYRQAWLYDLSTGQSEINFKANWDVVFSYYSKDGKYQVFGVNDDAQTKLYIRDTKTKQLVDLPELPDGNLSGVNFTKDSKTIVFYVDSDTSPLNLYVHQLGTDKVTRLTDTGNPNINEDNLVSSEVIRFKSFDGLEIPTLLYKPKQADTKKVPAVILIHGGPGGQSRKGYQAVVQHLVNAGIAVAQINNRGSSGYGKTFFHLDDRKHGDHDLQDVI